MAAFSPDYSLYDDQPQKAALQEILAKFGTQGATQPTQPTTPTDPTAATSAIKAPERPTDPRVRQLILWFKSKPEYALLEEDELRAYAEGIIEKGGHMPDEEPEGGQ